MMAELAERVEATSLFATTHGAAAELARCTGTTARTDTPLAGNSSHNDAPPTAAATRNGAGTPAVAGTSNGAGINGAATPTAATTRNGAGTPVAAGARDEEAPGTRSGDAVDRVVGLLDALVGGLRGLAGELLEERLGLVGVCEARLAAVKSETVAALAGRVGEAKAADVLRNGLKQSRGDAKRDVLLAGWLAELPGTRRALSDGAITPQHAKMIAQASEHTAVDETELLPAAENEPADVFARTLRDHVNDRSGGDLEERRKQQRARRQVSFTKQSDGMYKLFGLFDPVAGNRMETALAAAARKLWTAEDPKNRATPAQRFADALELLVTRTGAGKSQGTNLLVIADYDNVAGQLANPRLAEGHPSRRANSSS